MGWAIHYKAVTSLPNINEFISKANSQVLNLSENCEEFKWNRDDDYNASGFTKVEYSKDPKNDFITILKTLKKLSRIKDIEVIVSDDYYIDNKNIKKVIISKVFQADEDIKNNKAEPFNMDKYVEEYEIKLGLSQKIEDILPTCTDETIKNRVIKSIEMWHECGIEEIYTRRHIFTIGGPTHINEELVFLKIPNDEGRRTFFAEKASKLYRKEIQVSSDNKFLTTKFF